MLSLVLASLIATANLDVLNFGHPGSEALHRLTPENSDVVTGGLHTPARRLLPRNPTSWTGGKVGFDMAVDSVKQNYITVRLWGSDTTEERLILFCEGKQIGYHHIGDIDLIDFGTEGNRPAFNERFYYVTTPLPQSLTNGKSSLRFEIRSIGRIWGYGQTFEQYQRQMDVPTRGIYSAYTHSEGYFTPPPDERQGKSPSPPVRRSPGPEILGELKTRLNKRIDGLISKKTPLSQMEAHTLARAYRIRWTNAFKDPTALAKVVEAGDDLYRRYKADPKLVTNEPSTWNADWFGFGPFGQVVELLAKDFNFEANISAGLTRRAAYAEMLKASVDYLRTHRRWYTNQSMIVDLYLYLSNRGLRTVAPAEALPEAKALDYLYQSIGLKPWLGSDLPDGTSNRMLGDSYFQITKKGLTRELGYVGYYGEVLDWVTMIYEATKKGGTEGDPAIKAQLIKLARARAPFRYPAVDSEGNRAMRIEAIVGWRDAHYPGDIVYGQRFAWDGSALFMASQTGDPYSTGYAQQMMRDNQFFSGVAEQMTRSGLRVDAGLVDVPGQVEAINSASVSKEQLPMSGGDFVWSDEEDGVVAVKNGEDILYVSLYWRARAAVNFLAKVHLIRPTIDRVATVTEEVRFEPSGHFYIRPDNINSLAQGTRTFDYGDIHSAHAGERLPIAKVPEGTAYKPGQESVYAGRGSFYVLRYGPYLIAMNMGSKPDTVALPTGSGPIRELATKRTIAAKSGKQTIAPHTTAVYFLGG